MASTGLSSSAARTDADAARADVVVGLLSYQSASAVGQVGRAIHEGLTSYFGDVPKRLVLVDAGSTDDTLARAREALPSVDDVIEIPPQAPPALLTLPYHGMPGKPRALQALLTCARDLDARVCVVLDASVETATPRWVEELAGPVLAHDVDFVSPYYSRHPFEGALTKGLVSPLVRALYAARLRQPAAAEFACSRRAIDWLLDEDIWEREGAQAGIDLWVTTAVVSGDFRIGEAALGRRSAHARGEEALDLATTFTQVVGSLFADLEPRVETWQRRRGSVAVPLFGEPPGRAAVQDVSVDPERLMESFRLGYRELRDVWTWFLPVRTIVDLGRLVPASPAQFHLADDVWARIVYDAALGYRLRTLPRDHLLRAMVPLYLGWLASFVLEVRNAGATSVDARLEQLGVAFEGQKSHLIARWRWPERLRT